MSILVSKTGFLDLQIKKLVWKQTLREKSFFAIFFFFVFCFFIFDAMIYLLVPEVLFIKTYLFCVQILHTYVLIEKRSVVVLLSNRTSYMMALNRSGRAVCKTNLTRQRGFLKQQLAAIWKKNIFVFFFKCKSV